MIPEKVEAAFNEQVKYELESAYLYLAMAAFFEAGGLSGMATWMRAQVQEEVTHAMRFYRHVIDRGGRAKLLALAEPQFEWASPLAAFEAAYKHEQFITGRINMLARLGREQNDFASQSLLQWFIDEQVEEEDSTLKVVQQLKLIGKDGNGLLMLDKELGTRAFALPPDLAAFYAQGTAGA